VLVASFPAGPWQTNTYVVAADRGAECVVIDPGMDAEAGVADLVAEHRLKPVAVMVTHGHLDHMFAVAPLCRANDAPCWVHPDDRDLLADPLRSMGAETRALLTRLVPGHSGFVEPDEVRELHDGSVVSVAGVDFLAAHAPGHTPGSTMFATGPDGDEPLVFSGDVLFAGSIGRTDLPGGDLEAMVESLRTKVLPLPDPAVVLPGHGPRTTMAVERATNPYLRQLAEVPR
jgi:glyoxylase-like metal-dependent hydrolase (beta-lactamase superfamily II)